MTDKMRLDWLDGHFYTVVLQDSGNVDIMWCDDNGDFHIAVGRKPGIRAAIDAAIRAEKKGATK